MLATVTSRLASGLGILRQKTRNFRQPDQNCSDSKTYESVQLDICVSYI